jgi:hypothetical protein
MNTSNTRATFGWWEYVVYVAVTVPLLLIGLVLWFLGLLFKAATLMRRRQNY